MLTSFPGVIYASTSLASDRGFAHLEKAVTALLESVGEQSMPDVLWTLRYQQHSPLLPQRIVNEDGGLIAIPPLPQDLALDGSVLKDVKKIWQKITGESEDSFMRFEAREGMEVED